MVVLRDKPSRVSGFTLMELLVVVVVLVLVVKRLTQEHSQQMASLDQEQH